MIERTARHARHAMFLPSLSLFMLVREDTGTATFEARSELTLPDPFRHSNDQHQRAILRLSLL